MIGIALAVTGNLIISVALALTKYAHNLNAAREIPQPYTRLPLWWCGLFATVLGEMGNFAAYGFAGASLIAPLGAVSVLANAAIAAVGLKEAFRFRDLLGCLLCVLGGCTIVVSAPSSSSELEPRGFLHALQATPFVIYSILLLATCLFMMAFQDTYGHRHVAYYVLLCSLLGSVTVMSCKGVSTFLNLWLCCGFPSPFAQPVMYPLALVLASTAVLQIRYLNEAMERFGNTETVPVYYVLFTLCTIVGSNMLYRDFEHADTFAVALFAGGCSLTFLGVRLLTSGKDALTERTSRRTSFPPSDDKRMPMLPTSTPSTVYAADVMRVDAGAGAGAAAEGGSGSGLGGGSNGQWPPSSFATPGGDFPPERAPWSADNPMHFDDDYGTQRLDGFALVNAPMGVSGDVLRRTFSTRLATFADRAAQPVTRRSI